MIYLGSDHRGFKLKEELEAYLKSHDITYKDLCACEYDKEDSYVEFAKNVAKAVLQDKGSKGIVVCGSGIGVSIVANRFKGIRAGLFFNKEQTKEAVEHDHVNVAALPADYLTKEQAIKIIKAFLETEPINEEKYIKRIQDIDK
ncbi:MAG: RpiB/LacA/LacB family sugar-phosphate isomerase [Patescibacteria group bacterium]